MLRSFAHQLTPPLVARVATRAVRRVFAPEKHFEEQELRRLRRLPSFKAATTDIFGTEFRLFDGKSFAHLYNLHFRQQILRFEPHTDSPRIIDCGANIGITVMLWKTWFPKATVVAFEADPEIYKLLCHNCAGLRDVQLVNAAVWNEEGDLSFASQGGEGGHLAKFTPECSKQLRTVRAVRLREFLRQPCDFLKMDIEGAEIEVIKDSAELLTNVKRAFIEYHSFVELPQQLGSTLELLERAGFRLHVHTELPSGQPFKDLTVLNHKDLRLDLFCYRSETGPSALRL